MHQSSRTIRVLLVFTAVVLILGWCVARVDTSPAFAERPRVTPSSRSVFIVPTPRPTPTADYTFRPLLSIPYVPYLPSRTARKVDDMSQASMHVVADMASSSPPSEESADLAMVEVPDGVINIVLLGTDKRPEQGGWRTDTIIVVSINPLAQSVSMLSIPRDLWVEIPGFGVGRINTVDFIGEWKDAEGGGPGLLKRTIEANLGLAVHRYARIDLEGFIRVIDALGGVTIGIDCPIHDAFLDEPLTGEEGFTRIDLDVGVHHLDGLTALRYARSRLQGTDFSRARRQQKLLRSLAEQNLNWQLIPKLPRLWQTLGDAVDTDLALPEIIQLASVGVKIQQNRIKSRFIDWRTTENWITAGGAQVLLPNDETLPQAVAEFLDPPEENVRLAAEQARIEVHNGTAVEGLAEVAAQRLRQQGLDVVGVGRTARLQRSVILVNHDKPHTLQMLQNILRLSSAAVVRSPVSLGDVDIRVMLGSDWEPCP